VRFENVEEGVTVARQVDEVTGLSTLVVIDAKRRGSLTKTMRPQVKLLNDANEEVKIAGTEHAVAIGFQVGALIMVKDGQQVSVGEVLARIPTESQKPVTLPVVCHALPNCSKHVRRKMPACWRKSPVRLPSVKKPRASSVWKSPTWTATSTSS
jgi:thymidine phosphorylase